MSSILRERINTQPLLRRAIGARRRRIQMKLLMLLADLSGFVAAAAVFLLLDIFLKFFVFGAEDLKYLIIPLFCLILLLYSKLYPGVGVNPAEEIKLVTQYVTTGFLAGWIVLLWMGAGQARNHFALPILWAVSGISILLSRWAVRFVAAKFGLWGEPVVVMGRGADVERTIRYFVERRRLGYVPVIAVVDEVQGHPLSVSMQLIERSTLLESDVHRFSKAGIETLMVDVPAISEFFRSDESKALFRLFRRIILVSDLDWIDGASMHIHDYEGLVGITAQKGALTWSDAFLKRAMDIIVSILTGLALLPVALAAAIWIKLDSPGRVIYSQLRIGKDRRAIRRPGEHRRKLKIYKFRTMFADSESALQAYLHAHEKARDEWAATQKLCADPRVTRAGRFLRKFSIDELPQLFNVVKGDMSLVGPRPMMEDQLSLYGNNTDAYVGVRPGITGLWQVSGRNKTTFEERVRFDIYYIRNWSVWLDIYILLRTVWVVLYRDGAF